jgi:hypothetical protein
MDGWWDGFIPKCFGVTGCVLRPSFGFEKTKELEFYDEKMGYID